MNAERPDEPEDAGGAPGEAATNNEVQPPAVPAGAPQPGPAKDMPVKQAPAPGEMMMAALPSGENVDRGAVLQELRTYMRVLEALLFASDKPIDERTLQAHLPKGISLSPLLRELQFDYAGRGVQLRRIGDAWAFRTAPDLAFLLKLETVEPRKLSRAAIETLAIIAYHQPVTRAEIEEIRGVGVSKGTLDFLVEIGWAKMGPRRETPGRPTTYVTTTEFLDHFGLASTKDLPGLRELREAGFLDLEMPDDFGPTADAEHQARADVDDDDEVSENEREAAAALAVDDANEPIR